MIYVAVVCKLWDRAQNQEGSWSCFVDKRKSQAIKKAIQERTKWESKGSGPYRILVGMLKEEVAVPSAYSLRPVAWWQIPDKEKA